MKNLLLILSLVAVSGCSALWYSNPEAAPPEQSAGNPYEARPETDSAPPAGSYEQFAATPPDVEVIWAIPDSPVEQYIIQYGFARESLDNSVTVSANMLEKYEDPAHGFVYKYVLQGIPEFQTVYVSLTAQTGGETSPPSPVFEIPGK